MPNEKEEPGLRNSLAESGPENADNLTRPFCLPDWLTAAAFCILFAGACLDYDFLGLHIATPHLWFGYGFLLLLAVGDREGGLLRRLAFLLGALLVSLLAIDVFRHQAEHDTSGRRAYLTAFLHTPVLPVHLASLWLAAPVLLDFRSRRYSPWLRGAVGLLVAFGLLTFAAAVSSRNARFSLADWPQETGFYLPLLIAWIRAASRGARLRAVTGGFAVVALVTLVAATAFVGAIAAVGGAPERASLVEFGLLHPETSTDPQLPRWRLNFPLLYFNRTACLMLIAAGCLWAASFTRWAASARTRWLLRLAFAPALFAIVLTGTRGALLALIAGAVVWVFFSLRRLAVRCALAGVLLVVVAGAFLATPNPVRGHFLAPFRAETYRVDPARPTSMAMRFLYWRVGCSMIAEEPWTGLGYGTRVVRQAYPDYAGETDDYDRLYYLHEGAQHLHNVWLEIAAENGLPAAFVFLLWTLLRWRLLWQALRSAPDGRARRRVASWVALESALLVFGMLFYMLRRNFGLLTWSVWVWVLVEAAQSGATSTPAGASSEGVNR